MTDVLKYSSEKMVREAMEMNNIDSSIAISLVADEMGVDYADVERNVRFAPITSPMTSSEIEEELVVSRQNVSQITKRALRKVFIQIRRLDMTMTPFEIACYIADMFGVQQTEKELSKFFGLFPKALKNLIKESAINQCRVVDQERIIEDERKKIQAMQELSQLQT